MKKTFLILLILAGFTVQAQQPVDIYHHVPFIPQPTRVSCWSSSIAMILWWRDNQNSQMCLVDALTPEQVADQLGYWEQHFQDGLDNFDSHPFEVYNFVTVQPMSFPVETLAGFLRHGPVWVAYNGCANPLHSCAHAVVLVGIRGNGTSEGTQVILHDPDDGSGTYPSLGVRDRQMPFTEFVVRLNERALKRLTDPEAATQAVLFLAYPRN